MNLYCSPEYAISNGSSTIFDLLRKKVSRLFLKKRKAFASICLSRTSVCQFYSKARFQKLTLQFLFDSTIELYVMQRFFHH